MSELTPSSFRLPSPSVREDAEVLSKPVVEEEEIRLWDYWRVIRRRLWFIEKGAFKFLAFDMIQIWNRSLQHLSTNSESFLKFYDHRVTYALMQDAV
jgi:hypothetical protein